eukprot:jgi/Undpi1/374/HiC_scaffold_1.g00370.m1
MEGEFDDINSDRLSEDMYSQEDVEEILDGLRGCVVTNLRQEVGAVANMSALLMKQMLEDAEQQGAILTFDTSTVEDQALLDEVERMRVDGNVGRGSGQGPRLVSIKDEHARLLNETKQMKISNETLQERVLHLQQECSALLHQREEDKGEMEALRHELRFQAGDKSEGSCKGSEGDKETGNDDATQREISALKAANERRLMESPQFQQMKKLLYSKSQQVVSLRRRLEMYEPDEDSKREDEEDAEEGG